MKYIDYREKLCIGFNDEQIFKALLNRIEIALDLLCNAIKDSYRTHFDFTFYFVITSEKVRYPFSRDIDGVRDNILRSNSINELVLKCVALINMNDDTWKKSEHYSFFKQYFFNALDDLNILFDEKSDADGVFIFPKGAKELDVALVSQPLEWLQAYPKSYSTFCRALKQYANGEYARDVADNFRKALEEFLQEFLGNSKNLDNNKTELFKMLGQKGADPKIAAMIDTLLDQYNTLNNQSIKHNDALDSKYLEFLMYQTGLFIRMIITTCKKEEK